MESALWSSVGGSVARVAGPVSEWELLSPRCYASAETEDRALA